MRVFVTGATGFIGGHVARLLRERGDDVSALVRSPAKAAALEKLGCKIITGELSDQAAIAAGLAGCDALIHGAAVYEVGIPKSEHRRMYEANVLGTERVLSAALEAGTPKVVYISTIAVFGNTHGEVVDETYEHPAKSFTSYYEETKHEAHGAAKRLIAAGLLGGELTTMRGLMTTLAGVAGRSRPSAPYRAASCAPSLPLGRCWASSWASRRTCASLSPRPTGSRFGRRRTRPSPSLDTRRASSRLDYATCWWRSASCRPALWARSTSIPCGGQRPLGVNSRCRP